MVSEEGKQPVVILRSGLIVLTWRKISLDLWWSVTTTILSPPLMYVRLDSSSRRFLSGSIQPEQRSSIAKQVSEYHFGILVHHQLQQWNSAMTDGQPFLWLWVAASAQHQACPEHREYETGFFQSVNGTRHGKWDQRRQKWRETFRATCFTFFY